MDVPCAATRVGLIEECGIVVGSLGTRDGAEELLVALPGRAAPEPAILYPSLVNQPAVAGDRVLLNTTAVSLGLGSGGYHFVIANLSRPPEAVAGDHAPGHIIKLRYTPSQVRCLAVEEQQSPFHEALRDADSITGMPVVVAGLHSQLAPIAAAVKARTAGAARVAYVMTDTACMALGFSTTVPELRGRGLLDVTITAGQAFGGELEAVNTYSALLAARHVARADVAIVAQGPGNVGTETLFGFGSIYQGEALNAVDALGGLPIAAARLSFADPRPRHRGLSRQFLVSLARVARCRADVVLPEIGERELGALREQLSAEGIDSRHHVVIESGAAGIGELERLAIRASSMGRGLQEDREFFLAAAAAGAWAGRHSGVSGV